MIRIVDHHRTFQISAFVIPPSQTRALHPSFPKVYIAIEYATSNFKSPIEEADGVIDGLSQHFSHIVQTVNSWLLRME
jgi:hypothetical protein